MVSSNIGANSLFRLYNEYQEIIFICVLVLIMVCITFGVNLRDPRVIKVNEVLSKVSDLFLNTVRLITGRNIGVYRRY